MMNNLVASTMASLFVTGGPTTLSYQNKLAAIEVDVNASGQLALWDSNHTFSPSPNVLVVNGGGFLAGTWEFQGDALFDGQFRSGAGNGFDAAGNMTCSSIVSGGNVQINLGSAIKMTSGANAKCGMSQANGSTSVNVSTTAVTANSKIVLCPQSSASNGALFVTVATVGVGFSFKSTSAGDTAIVFWFIVEMA